MPHLGRPCAVVLLACPLVCAGANPARSQTATAFDAAWHDGVPTVVSGTLTVLVADDFARERAETFHVIREARTGRTLQLRLDRPPARRLYTGITLTLHGRVKGPTLFVRADLLDAALPPEPTGAAAGPTAVSGDQRTLVILADFTDAALSCTRDAVRDVLFTDPSGVSVDRQYREASGGQVSFSGEVAGPFTMPFASGSPCDIGRWADAADAAALAAGETPSAYARKVYVLPPSSCGAAGYGTVGGTPSGAWIFACGLKGVFAHELGHNLGMDHASTPTSEYGDSTDPMAYGSTRLRGVNAPHRRQLGWLDGASLLGVVADGVYDLAPLASDPAASTAPRAIAIAKPDTAETYVVSYRTAQGFDNYIDGTYLDRVSVHRVSDGASAGRSVLLAGLADGAGFEDAVNRVTVTALSHGPAGATVQVQFRAASCTPAAPSIAVDPAVFTVSAGATATFTIGVTSHDGTACPPSTFTLASSTPAAWTGIISPATLTIAPGATAEAVLSVTPPASSVSGTSTATVSLSDPATPVHAAAAVATVVVEAVPICAPGAPSLAVTPASQTALAGSTVTYTLSVANNDSAACAPATFAVTRGVPSGWASALSSSAVTLAPGASAQVALSVTSAADAPQGPAGVSVAVADASGVHAAAAAATYVVERPEDPGDTEPPSPPISLAAVVRSKQKQVALSWLASWDSVGVAGYRVLRDGVVAGTTAALTWTDSDYAGGTTRTYAVVAFDAAGNVSGPSGAVTVALPGPGKKR